MALPAVPEWLKLRDGTLRPGVFDTTVLVLLGGTPQYRLDARPGGGQYICNVIQTINGRMVGNDTKYPTKDAAWAGGLDTLRETLGW